MLSVLTDRKRFQGSGIVAQITLVKGSEYKSDAHFRKGWIPIAIVVVPDSSAAGTVVYPKLKLHGGTSWLYVREESPSKWDAALVRIAGGKIEQDPLNISVARDDNLEPVIGARFHWEDDDESVWAYCGGNCCKVVNPR
jgi:carbonic anhydrase